MGLIPIENTTRSQIINFLIGFTYFLDFALIWITLLTSLPLSVLPSTTPNTFLVLYLIRTASVLLFFWNKHIGWIVIQKSALITTSFLIDKDSTPMGIKFTVILLELVAGIILVYTK